MRTVVRAPRSWRALAFTIALASVLSSCGGGESVRKDAASTGIASWYGPGFHGRRTSNGEIYDQHAMTAAHRTLPLGTRVRVTNLDNGRATEVRINDRGPFVDDREIDLSLAAARELAMVGPGTCRVMVEPILGQGERLGVVRFSVQVASFESEERAREYRDRLAATALVANESGAGIEAYVVPAEARSGRVYRVRFGPYAARSEAESRASRLSRAGWASVVVEEVASFR